MQEYQDGLVVVRERKYRRAVDDLERLVVQRLFEMKKLGMNGVGTLIKHIYIYIYQTCLHCPGYKLREKITKSLKTRADAIQSALKRYNEAAASMVPPRPALTWETVVKAVDIADFDILKDTRQDIRILEWAQPANREGMVMYFQIKRAKEEINRLNVEIRRLLTFLYDDHVDHFRAIHANKTLNPSLSHEIFLRWQYRSKIHEEIVKRILQTSKLVGFSGSLFYGQRKGRDVSLNADIPPPSWVTILGITQVEVDITDVDDSAFDNEDDADTDGFVDLLNIISLDD